MTAQRRADTKQAAHLYVNRFPKHPFCIYCGEPATGRDHFLPLGVAADIDWSIPGMVAAYRKRLFTLPCCIECNSLAKMRIFDTIRAKRRYIQDRLRRKYQRLLTAPSWCDEDMKGLGRNLRSMVGSMETKARQVRRRIVWPRERKNAP